MLGEQKLQYVYTSKFLQVAEMDSTISEKREAKAMLQGELARLGIASAQAARHQKRKVAKSSGREAEAKKKMRFSLFEILQQEVDTENDATMKKQHQEM